MLRKAVAMFVFAFSAFVIIFHRKLNFNTKEGPQAFYEPAVLSFWAILFSQPLFA